MKACIIDFSCCTNDKEDEICTHPYYKEDYNALPQCKCKNNRCLFVKKDPSTKHDETFEDYVTRLFKNNVVRYTVTKNDGKLYWNIIGCGIGKIKERDLIQDAEYKKLYQPPPSIKEMCKNTGSYFTPVPLLNEPKPQDDEPKPQVDDTPASSITNEVLFKILHINNENKEFVMVFASKFGEQTDELIRYIKSQPEIELGEYSSLFIEPSPKIKLLNGLKRKTTDVIIIQKIEKMSETNELDRELFNFLVKTLASTTAPWGFPKNEIADFLIENGGF
jgi:hypothetical protein